MDLAVLFMLDSDMYKDFSIRQDFKDTDEFKYAK